MSTLGSWSMLWRYDQLPVRRNYRNGVALRMNEVTINRSDVIRRIFYAEGNITNAVMHDTLAQEGIYGVSDSLITQQRRTVFGC